MSSEQFRKRSKVMPPWTSRLAGGYRKLSTSTTGNIREWMPQNEFLRRAFRRSFEFTFSNRRLVIIIVLTVLLLLYFFPIGFRSGSVISTETSFWCLYNQLTAFSSHVSNFDAFVRHHPSRLDDERPFVHFVGNGHIGLGVRKKDDSQLRIFHERSLALATGLLPLVSASVSLDYSSESAAYATDLMKGKVTYFHVYRKDLDCIVVEEDFYAHRTRPQLLFQEITVRNPTSTAITINLKRSQPTWTDVSTKTSSVGGHDENVRVYSKQIYVPGSSEKIYAISALLPEVAETVSVPASSSDTFRIMTLVTYSQSSASNYSSQRQAQEENLSKLYSSFSSISPSVLSKDHETAWEQLWSSGFSISYSKAPDVLNGDQINATIYYVLSNTPSPLQEADVSPAERSKLSQRFYHRDRCYSAHNTLLYPSRLWSDMNTVQEVVELANRWKLTLQKRGCADFVRAGASGVLQAMVFSFGALKFTQHHLEFDAKPQDLHRDNTFRHLVYGEHAFVNIWVEVAADNKPVMYASVNVSSGHESKKLYACDAGCLDSPVELSSSRSFLPVKLTDPPTPILYITDDRQHIEELKHSIHVMEVVDAPAHEHHVMAMHKHGHRLGGLPTIFWVALVFLLIVFHLFLFNLIYNEYCRDEKQLGTGRSSASTGTTMASGQSSSHHSPKDANVMAAILKDVGVDDYEPRVINQMLEFAYRYVSDTLDDARVYSEFAGKKSVDVEDVRLSVQMKVDNTLTNPPSREMMAELAQEKNAIPLPPLKQQYGLRLPPDRYCTLQPNFRLKSPPATGPTAALGARPLSVSSMSTAFGSSTQGGVRVVPQQQRPKHVSSPKPVKTEPVGAQAAVPGSTAVSVTKPPTSGPAKPLFRLVAGSSVPSPSAPRPAAPASSIGQSEPFPTTSGGVKRKLEPLDEDYDYD